MDGGERAGVCWTLVGDIRRSDAGSDRHSDDDRVPLEVRLDESNAFEQISSEEPNRHPISR